MKKRALSRIAIFIVILMATMISLISCKAEPMGDGDSINEYIFPYIDFTLSEDESYYTASVVNGATLAKVYIPSAVDDRVEGSIPVRFFNGFNGSGDESNLETIVFESSDTIINSETLDKAGQLYTLQYEKVVGDNDDVLWTNLPHLPNTEEHEFHGWVTSNSNVQIYDDDVMIPGYTTLNPIWGSHDWKSYSGKEVTCTENGYNDYKVCQNEDCKFSTYKEITALGHSLVYHKTKEPTCLEDGYTENCYECTRCGKFFLDSEGTEEIAKDSVVLDKTGHAGISYTDYDKSQHYWYCSTCGKSGYEDHEYGDWVYEDTEQYRECSKCGHIESSRDEHEWEHVPYKASTCIEKGHKEYWKCTNHGDEYSLASSGDVIINEETLHGEVDLGLADHTLGDSYESDSTEHWKVCAVCNEKLGIAEHTWEYIFDPDKESRVLTVRRMCAVCKKESSSQSSGSSAFDISASFGWISISKTGTNTWELSYPSDAKGCVWKDEKGNELIEGSEKFTIAYASSGKGRFRVYCSELNENGKEIDISFAVLTAY